MYSWRQIHDFSQPLTVEPNERSNDEVVTYRVVDPLPVIVLDPETKRRRVVAMQWGFPHPKNPRRPQPIHARSETIDTVSAFADAFREGQRGIVVFRTFNEGKELSPSKTEQWVVDPGDGVPRGFAFVWRRFEIEGRPMPLMACVMATVPANKLVAQITDRMPAILEDRDWANWLGEEKLPPAQVKALLKTMEGVTWKMEREPKRPKADKPKPAAPEADPTLL